VQYALRYGVPVVTTSGQEDKPEVAARIAWSGAGRRLKTATPTPAAVDAAVRTVLHDPGYRARAQEISRSMTRAGGLADLARLVDHATTIAHAARQN
jgi:UDP:flavonoid glycosyltransferase YjiC (YdhE family)